MTKAHGSDRSHHTQHTHQVTDPEVPKTPKPKTKEKVEAKEADPKAAKELHKGEKTPGKAAPAKGTGAAVRDGDAARAEIKTLIDAGDYGKLAHCLTGVLDKNPGMLSTVVKALGDSPKFDWHSLVKASSGKDMGHLGFLVALAPKEQRPQLIGEIAKKGPDGMRVAADALNAVNRPEAPAIAAELIKQGMQWSDVSLAMEQSNVSVLSVAHMREGYIATLRQQSPQVDALFKDFEKHPQFYEKHHISKEDLEDTVMGKNPPNVTDFFKKHANDTWDQTTAKHAGLIVDAELHTAMIYKQHNDEALTRTGDPLFADRQKTLEHEIKVDKRGLQSFHMRAAPKPQPKPEPSKPVDPKPEPQKATPEKVNFASLAEMNETIAININRPFKSERVMLTPADFLQMSEMPRESGVAFLEKKLGIDPFNAQSLYSRLGKRQHSSGPIDLQAN